MEIFELRYFLGVAETENIHRASEKLSVSPGSLSKAIMRLEDELSIKLFQRQGRNIELTDQGRLLQRRASTIIQLEEDAKLEVAGQSGTLQVKIAGSEILLSQMGIKLSQVIQENFPQAIFEFHSTKDEEAIKKVAKGEAHLGLVTGDVSAKSGLSSKNIAEVKFHTYVGKGHPLYAAAKAKRVTPVEEILKYPFVSPNNPLLGKVGPRQSLDGWRDDQFPRKIEYLTSSLMLLEELVFSGKAMAYLPDYFRKRTNIESLKISGCPYFCMQKVKLVARNPKDIGWINQIF